MGLLSLLGDECVQVDTEISDPLITVLLTRSQISKTIALIIVYSNNTAENVDVKKVRVGLSGLDFTEGRYVIYLLDNISTNPFLIWRKAGSPVFPSEILRAEMRKAQVNACGCTICKTK